MLNIISIREYDAPEHILSLTYLHNKGRLNLIKSPNIYTFRSLIKNILHFNPSKILSDLEKILRMLTIIYRAPKNSIVIIGCAPFNPWALFHLFFFNKYKKVLHTSWDDWNLGKGVHFNNKLGYFIWNQFLEKIDMVITTSKPAKNSLIEFKKDLKIKYIPHCVNFKNKSYIKRDYPSNKKKIKLIYCGRITEEKGIFDLCEAIKIDKKFELTVVGEGKQKLLLEKKYASIKNIKIIGYVDYQELPKIFQKNDIICLFSKRTKNWHELFGMVLIEAMFFNLAVAVSNEKGPSWIAKNSKAGLVLEKNVTKESILDLLNKFARDKASLRKMQDNAGSYSRKYFDIREVSKIWIKTLKLI